MSLVFIETPRITDSNGRSSKATSGHGTTITLQSGEQIPEVKSVDVHIAFNKVITADIHLHAAFKGTAEATFHVADPRTGEYRAVSKIVFADGSEWSGS
jgi:hypothetical protein